MKMKKKKLCKKCLFLIQTWRNEFMCIYPDNKDNKSPSEINKDKDCGWWEKAPGSMI